MKKILILAFCFLLSKLCFAQWNGQGWNVQPTQVADMLWEINADNNLSNKDINGRTMAVFGDNVFGFGIKGGMIRHLGLNPQNLAFSFSGDVSASTGNAADTLVSQIGVAIPSQNIAAFFRTAPYAATINYDDITVSNDITLDNSGIQTNASEDYDLNVGQNYDLSANQVTINSSSIVQLNPSDHTTTTKDIYITDATKGVILKTDTGICVRMQINDAFQITTTPLIVCP
ncbi:MAG: hypothetical protein ACPG5B_16720 [Chitinophagales bacterium]